MPNHYKLLVVLITVLFIIFSQYKDMADTHTSVIKEKADVNGEADKAAEVKPKNEEVSDGIQDTNGEVREL